MIKVLNNVYPNVGLLVLRVFFGLAMAFSHGLPKLAGFGDKMDVFPDPIGLGSPIALALVVFAEFFCALAVSIGLFTKYSLVPLVVTMLVAAFVIHGADPFGKKEMALCYLFAYVALFLLGPGKYSVDHKMGRA